MKWSNKGHEYDYMYQKISEKKKFLFVWCRRLWKSVFSDI